MKIVTYPNPWAPADMAWSAIDESTYDGAPDASPRARAIGTGLTPAAAEADLREILSLFDDEDHSFDEEEGRHE
jgi:hypothetical protein